MERQRDTLKKAISELKQLLDFDSTAIDHLHLALYTFQDAVITVLRSVSIKPHWMFALDNLVKGAVHAGLMILSPELGANLAGHDRPDDIQEADEDDVDELSNSVSTVDSSKAKNHAGMNEAKILMDQVHSLKEENSKLLNELLESQKSLQSVLKAQTQEHGVLTDVLKNFMQLMSKYTRTTERHNSVGYCSDDQYRKSCESSPVYDETDKSQGSVNSKKNNIPLFKNPQLKSPLRQCHDIKLSDWLIRYGFDEESRQMVSNADFTYEDFIYETDKDDIRRIGLRQIMLNTFVVVY